MVYSNCHYSPAVRNSLIICSLFYDIFVAICCERELLAFRVCYGVLIVCVPFSFVVWGRMWNSRIIRYAIADYIAAYLRLSSQTSH